MKKSLPQSRHRIRRPGAPARLVASSRKIYEKLGWKAEYSLEQIIESA
ncbi:UDP-glucose 4-epimerase [Anoxybacillus voinovskiensis]|uniref:UDP-glucose 4-epimerase n=1 Tax=Anoxybacteroides voinovskiense TaxID=230470 RepID=A0A840DYG8_9BACL|nr:UDP-glucose 4-epimerase [Anoxybacillus voinovskiensis]